MYFLIGGSIVHLVQAGRVNACVVVYLRDLLVPVVDAIIRMRVWVLYSLIDQSVRGEFLGEL